MTDSMMSARIEVRWVAVAGTDGREHLEQRWIATGGSAAAPSAAHDAPLAVTAHAAA